MKHMISMLCWLYCCSLTLFVFAILIEIPQYDRAVTRSWGYNILFSGAPHHIHSYIVKIRSLLSRSQVNLLRKSLLLDWKNLENCQTQQFKLIINKRPAWCRSKSICINFDQQQIFLFIPHNIDQNEILITSCSNDIHTQIRANIIIVNKRGQTLSAGTCN